MFLRILCSCAIGLAVLGRANAAEPAFPRADLEFFEKEVRPLLIERCGECHGDQPKPKGGLRVTSRAAILKGGETGPAAIAGKPDESLLVEAVRYREEPRMPPKRKLADAEIATLARWVERGLPWPDSSEEAPRPSSEAAAASTAPPFVITPEQRRFWSFRPLATGGPPAVKDHDWPRTGLDAFLLAALEAKGLRPAPPAGKRTLIRRATFDLIGLPPTPEEVDAFLADDSAGAFARVVDRLLASPHYGERWGRHWLDLVRYTDSADARGLGGDRDFADAWRYRDWVVRAFNRDLPYNDFLLHQIAGDVLPPRVPGAVNLDETVATGMLAIGNWGGGDADKEKLLTDIADDQVDVVSRVFMGLTVACARCHDHKFDPISQADYYGLAGIFFSTHILPDVGPKTNGPPILRIPLASKAELAARDRTTRAIAALEQEVPRRLDRAKAELARSLLPETARYVRAAWESRSDPDGAARGLHEFAVRNWIEALGLAPDGPLLGESRRDLFGRPGLYAWRGAADAPSLTINTTDKAVARLTFVLPARSVTVHPGPTSGAVVTWISPISSAVTVSGSVADADPVGGDGIAWTLARRDRLGAFALAQGEFNNGGRQEIAPQGSIAVRPGDRIELTVNPRKEYSFDTTAVALTIRQAGDPADWELPRDLLDDPLAGNPHADRHGHPAVWRFGDTGTEAQRLANAADTSRPAAIFRRVLDEAPDDLERAARDVQDEFRRVDAASPFWIKTAADEDLLPDATRSELARLRDELAALKALPMPPLPFANGAQEGGVPGSPHAGTHDVRLHVRGSYARLGPVVPRHVPEIVAGEAPPAIASGSGRLELARWLARPDHPLTARVLVNRVWQHHFGAGIVRTPGNFGKLGEPPSHPELLDFLARSFVEGGWSIKRLHRQFMLSAAYQQSSIPDSETGKADPENRLFGRMGRRRLEAEALRDSLLAVSGRLDRRPGGPAPREVGNPRRTVYLMTIRSDRSGFGPLFDAADPTAIIDRRTVSTVAPQALFLLNHPFALDQARALAGRLLAEAPDDRARVERAYALLFARPPGDEERALARDCLGAAPDRAAWDAYCQILMCGNEFIYID